MSPSRSSVSAIPALAASAHHDFEEVICENGGADAYGRLTAAVPNALPGGQPVRTVLVDGVGALPAGLCLPARNP
jgi:N-acetylglucosaminyl-diphospho-decaprenol L-rhamnosyltransferase